MIVAFGRAGMLGAPGGAVQETETAPVLRAASRQLATGLPAPLSPVVSQLVVADVTLILGRILHDDTDGTSAGD